MNQNELTTSPVNLIELLIAAAANSLEKYYIKYQSLMIACSEVLSRELLNNIIYKHFALSILKISIAKKRDAYIKRLLILSKSDFMHKLILKNISILENFNTHLLHNKVIVVLN